MRYPTTGGLDRHYRVLGLAPGADARTVKAAYKRLARRWHPDAAPLDRRAPARFERISEAYRAIMTEKDRSAAEVLAFIRTVHATARPRDIIKNYRARIISTLLLSRLALSYIEEGAFDEARDILVKIDAEGPPLVSTRVNLAYLRFLEGEHRRAVETLYRARDDFGDDPMVVTALLALLRRAGRFIDAAKVVETCAEVAEDRDGMCREMANSVSFFDERSRVVRHLRRAVDDRTRETDDAAGNIVVLLLARETGDGGP